MSLALALALSLGFPVQAPAPAEAPAAPVRVRHGLVVSQSALASKVGSAILERGGNGVDAAVATAFALAVTYPEAGNIGGGGFLVVLLTGGKATTFDFREEAPAAATADMFLDEEGRYDPERHHRGLLSAGVPGTVAGLHLAHRRLGKLPWKDLVEPAVELAAGGIEVDAALAESLEKGIDLLRRNPASRAQFTKDGERYRAGETLVQPDLARTLERIRDEGPDGFYRGRTADLIAREMERGGGLITREDLASYRAVERRPVRGTYRGLEIISMGPPSSGGTALIEMLNILEGYDLREMGLRSAPEVHYMVEAMRRAFADRARHLGDPDHADIPVARLTSKEYARKLRRTISDDRASTSTPESFEWPAAGGETTHVSIVDAKRTAVSLTITLEQPYGSGITVADAGFLLNNEMGDFNPRRGLTTPEGLIGTDPNLAAPGKRMLSSMTPAIVAHEEKPVLVIGSPGGRTIINTVLEVVVNFIDHGLGVQEAIDLPRFHHQWLPDKVFMEAGGVLPPVRERLEAMGHTIVERGPQGSAMGIAVLTDGRLEAGVDGRRPGGGAAGH